MATGLVVVGLGPRGLQWGREVRGHPAFELVAGVDVDPGARSTAERELGVPMADLEPALSLDGVEAVIVATPPEHHEEPCRAALERGLAVLVEKPFTLDLASAVELVELAEAREAPLLVAQTFRYLRAHRAARAVIRAGRLGTVRQVTYRHYRIERPRFRHGIVWDLGVHHLDALRDLLGKEPTAVLATSFDDGLSAQVLLEFGDGLRGSYLATRRSSGHEFFEGGKELYLRVTGERGTLHVVHRWLVLCESGKLPRVLRRGRRPQSEDATVLDDFAAALRGTPGAGVTGRANIGTMALLDACARSTNDRRWVDV
jgi:predicted dehydrogenase